MIYLPRWKVILIMVVCALGVLYAMPNLLGKEAVTWAEKHLPGFLPHQTVNLGLDLRGGSHLLLEVQTGAVIDEALQGLVDQTRTELRAAKVGYTELGLNNRAVSFRLTDAAQADKARDILRQLDRTLDVREDGGAVSVRYTEETIRNKQRAAMDQSIEIVRRRIDETGTREPSIQRQGDNRILVQLPGVDDPDRIKRLLGQTAKLSFRLVEQSASVQPGLPVPPGTERLPLVERAGQQPGVPQSIVVQKRIMVSGDTLVDAQPTFQNGEPVVSFRFDTIGGKKFAEATRVNVGRPFAIVLDNKVISAPVIREPILGGSGVISGSFTTQSAQDLALLLRAGALPAPISVIEERTVGPGLGEDSIKAGATASLIGMGLVMVFILMSYGLFGVFANIALLFNVSMIFAVLSTLQATLTLPGIAGIVLTIGTALDNNVLIFERIREEQRNGRSPLAAIDAGYSRALSAIWDANMTSLIAAVLLYIFGSGPIKGFAVTLTIGIITSTFTSIMITRLIVVWWLKAKKRTLIPI
jgi:preprotein translocase subunit SecD